MHCKSWRSSQVQLKHKTQLRGKVISSPIWLVPLVKVSSYCKVRCLISNFEPEGDMGLWGLSLVTCGSFLCFEGLALLFCIPCSLEGMPLVNVVTFHIEWHHFHHTSPHLRALRMSFWVTNRLRIFWYSVKKNCRYFRNFRMTVL